MNYDRKKIDFLVNNPPNEFKKFDNLNYRVFQANEVINYLKQNQNTQEIYVVGHSEGYRVASKLSEINQNINKMICLSSNPFSRSVENILLKSTENYLYENDASRINQIEDEYFYNYLVNEDSSKDENYYSYNKHLPLDSFKKFKKPLLIAFGSNDLSSSLNLFLPFILVDQQNISVKSYPDLGHNFEKKTINKNDSAQTTYFWDAVFEDCVRWLLEN
jgi:esterase/lipase